MKYVSNIRRISGSLPLIEITDDSTGEVMEFSEGDFPLEVLDNLCGYLNDVFIDYFWVISKNPKDVKYSFMNPDVYIKTEDGCLKSLTVMSKEQKVIIFSDFCNRLDNYCLNLYGINNNNLTLVFDENIEIPDNAELCIDSGFTPIIDVTSCSDVKALDILKGIVIGHTTGAFIHRNVIANEKVHAYFSIYTVLKGYLRFDNLTHIDKSYILEYFCNNLDNIRKVLSRRDLTDAEISQMAVHILHINPTRMTAESLLASCPLAKRGFITEDDNYYLNLACLAEIHGLNALRDFEDFITYIDFKYYYPTILNNKITQFFYKLFRK